MERSCPAELLPEQPLSYTELNVGAESTILLIHGFCSSGTEWHEVAEHLSEYHLILPNLPSRDKYPLQYPSTLPSTLAGQLAVLIREKATHGKAHVIGHSYGAHVAIRLISTYPDLIDRALVTGYNVFPYNPRLMASTFWLGGRIDGALSKCLGRLPLDPHGAPTLDEFRELMNTVCSAGWPAPWPAQTLIVAARKQGFFGDHVKDAGRLQEIGIRGNSRTVAYMHHDLAHAWHLDKAEMFAITTRMWFEDGEVPDGFDSVPKDCTGM